MLVPDLLRRAAGAAPERTAAVVDGGGEMTYGEWEARSNALARGLVARGLQPGDRVGLFFENPAWLDYAVSYFAVLKAGCVAVPVSPRFAEPEVRQVLEHAGARCVLVQPEHAEAAARACPAGVEWVEADPARPAAGQPTDAFQVVRSEDDLADIIYTSGTTGLPKGVASPHGNVAFEHTAGGMPWAGETFIHAIPLATFAGTYAMMVLPVASQMTNVVLPRFDPERFCALAAERRASIAYLVPAMARLILDSGAPARYDLSSVKVLRFGTAPMPPDTLARLADAFPSATLINVYGLTEAGPAGTMMAYDRARPTSVGRPIGATHLRIVSSRGEECAPGEVGEIWIGIPPTMRPRSYYRDPEATEATFRGEWVRTGDLGTLDADGYLFLVDRVKDVVIRGGFNVSTVEVEGVLQAHPAVAEAAVVGVPHEVLGEEVAAVVVLRSGARATPEELRAFCRERLADYKAPRRVEFADVLPRNPLGKVLKRELRSRLAGEPVAGREAPEEEVRA